MPALSAWVCPGQQRNTDMMLTHIMISADDALLIDEAMTYYLEHGPSMPKRRETRFRKLRRSIVKLTPDAPIEVARMRNPRNV
jgi:hypothetical protein